MTDDLISRQAAIKEVEKESQVDGAYGYMDTKSIVDLLEDLPSVERKKGVWIEENTRPRSSQFYCSICHRTAYDLQPTRIKEWTKRCRYAFCPNCGAMMEGDE